LNLDETASGLTDIQLAVEGTHAIFEVGRDGEGLLAIALNGVEEIGVGDADVSEVLALFVDDVEGGSNVFADGSGNNLEVEVEHVATRIAGFSHVGEAELEDLNGADGGGLRNVDIFDALDSLISGVLVSVSNFSG
jgi:hypothetical protein